MANTKQKVEITISNKTLLRVIVVLILALAAVRFVINISGALQLIFISIFLALALNPAVSWISRRLRIKSRVKATAIAYLLVLAFVAGFVFIVLPPFVRQTIDFAGQLPVSVEELQNQDTSIVRFIRDNNLTDQYTQVVEDFKGNIENITGSAFSTVSAAAGAIIAIVTVLIMTFMFLVEGPTWMTKFLSMQPADELERRSRVLRRMYGMVTGYVNGQVIIAIIASFFSLIALMIASTLFGVSINAVALAFLVGVLGLIPMFGNTIAAIIVVLVCLFVSIPLAITMAIFFLLYQQIENATLQPYVQSKFNELTPLLVFIAALIGVYFAGFLGALVAIPAAGCIRILVLEYFGDKLKPKNHEKVSLT